MPETKLSNCAVQVGLRFGLPRQTEQLKNEESRIQQENNAEAGTVRAQMYYFRKGKVNGLEPLRVFQSKMRKALEHFARYPYLAGTRILPAAVVEPFLQVKAEFDAQIPSVWMAWADEEYPEWRDSAPTRMGHLYNAATYPTLADCRSRFINEVSMAPIGEKEQVQRISLLSPNITALVTQSADEAHQKAVQATAKQNFNDVMGLIMKIVDTLKKDKTKLHDSMIENLVKMVDLVPAVNITGDEQLIALAQAAREQLCNISVDDLRESAAIKAKTLAAATTIINTFQPYQRKFGSDDDEN